MQRFITKTIHKRTKSFIFNKLTKSHELYTARKKIGKKYNCNQHKVTEI